MEPRLKLTLTDGEPLPDAKQYRRIIGRLLYLNLTRPDITFATHKLSQFVSQPRTHLHAAYHVLRYLKTNPANVYSFQLLLRFIFEPFQMLTGPHAWILESQSLASTFFLVMPWSLGRQRSKLLFPAL